MLVISVNINSLFLNGRETYLFIYFNSEPISTGKNIQSVCRHLRVNPVRRFIRPIRRNVNTRTVLRDNETTVAIAHGGR